METRRGVLEEPADSQHYINAVTYGGWVGGSAEVSVEGGRGERVAVGSLAGVWADDGRQVLPTCKLFF